MRYMMIIKADENSEAGILPDREVFTAMGNYNEELVKAGVLLAAEGLHPSSAGAQVSHVDGRRVVTDGPFTETKELIAGFWLIQVTSRDEAIEWAARVPVPEGTAIEVRRVFEAADFPADAIDPADLAREQELRTLSTARQSDGE